MKLQGLLLAILLFFATALPQQNNHQVIADSIHFSMLGKNLVNNGAFTSGTENWVFPSFWTISSSKASFDIGSTGFTDSSAITQRAILTIGKQYRVSYAIGKLDSGELAIYLGTARGTTRSTVASFVDTITCTGTPDLKVSVVKKGSNFSGTVDDIVVQEIVINTDDIIDLGNNYEYVNITAQDTGTTYTDTIEVRAGTIFNGDTTWVRVPLMDGGWEKKTLIIGVADNTNWLVLRPYIRLLRLSFLNAQVVANRRWSYKIDAHK